MTMLRIYLEPGMLKTAREGTFNFMNVLRRCIEGIGWQVQFLPTSARARAEAADLPGYALFHMESPTHDRALTFRRAYHYPFWHIESAPQRWRGSVARAHFDPDLVPAEAAEFVQRLRARVLPDARPGAGDYALVPLQGRLRQQRSFQTMSPLDMLEVVAMTRRPTVATLHPKEGYDEADHAALAALAKRHANLTIGGDSGTLLPGCAFVATQNSAVAFDGLILEKPAVLFGQSDFHHIALNVAELGTKAALDAAASHKPDFQRYVWWFLRGMSINATAQDAGSQILAAMKKGGWPI